MLDANLKTQLKTYLENLRRPIVLAASLDDSKGSTDLEQLLEDIASQSDKVTWSRVDDQRSPSFAITTPEADVSVRFAGIPLGHEFTSLVLGLLHVGGHPPKVDDNTIEQIKNIQGDYNFEVYFSLSCQNCPDVVQGLNTIAALNPNVKVTSIDGAFFKSEVDAREIMSVPSIYLNGQPFASGRMDLQQMLAKLDTGAEARMAEEISEKAPFDVLVVGGGPAGAASAVYAARKGIRTGVASERFGGQVLDTMDIENLISVPHTDGPKLATALEAHVGEYDVDVMNLQSATRLVPADHKGGLHTIQLSNGAQLQSKTVILSTGARWRQLGVPGEEEYRNKGVAYCPHCDGPLFKGKRVAVIGGGNSGVEAAIDLAGLVEHVTLIEFDNQLRADAILQTKLHSLNNVDVITSAQTTEVTGDGKRVNGLVCRDRTTETDRTVELEGVFIQIGLVPNTEWLKGTIELSGRGEIEMDMRGATSIPGVFAAGDATITPYKQIVISMGEGARAALSAFDYLIRLAPAETKETAET